MGLANVGCITESGSVVKDGVLVGITPEGSDHSAVDIIRFDPETDVEVSVKFRFVSDKAKSFNVWFDDKDYKGSHAGHICNVSVSPANVTMADAKTGSFENAMYREAQLRHGAFCGGRGTPGHEIQECPGEAQA